MERIVVGIDGSPESKRALSWAAGEAAVHEADLHVLYAYGAAEEYNPYTTGVAAEYAPVGAATLMGRMHEEHQHEVLASQSRAEQVIERIVAEVLGPGHGLRMQVEVVAEDRPARALVDASRTADLLVVGSRGRGGFTGLLLGSVSQTCVRHADCPVIVIR